MLNTSHITTVLLMLLVIAFWLISTYCQISLFTSFVADGRDKFHAGVFAAVLVATQYLFVDQAARKWWAGQRILASTSFTAVVVLLSISVSCTALYFESRYQVMHSAATVNSDGYSMIKSLIDDKTSSMHAYKKLADEEQERGNKWMAGQHLKNAAAIERELPDLLSQLSSQKPKSGATAVISEIGDARWVLWWCFSLVADLIPAIAILLLRSSSAMQTAVVIETDAEQTKKQEENSSKTEEQPLTIKQMINQNGRMPSWREVRDGGMTYSVYKRQVEELQTAGVIERDGQSFRVLKAS